MHIPLNKFFKNFAVFSVFIFFSAFLGASSEDSKDLLVEKNPLDICDIELREFCNLETFDVKKERECVKRNISNLSSECANLIRDALDTSRPIVLPNISLPPK